MSRLHNAGKKAARPPNAKGSFAAQLDELVKLFPHEELPPARPKHERPQQLQEKVDIHSLLFAQAWALDEEGR